MMEKKVVEGVWSVETDDGGNVGTMDVCFFFNDTATTEIYTE